MKVIPWRKRHKSPERSILRAGGRIETGRSRIPDLTGHFAEQRRQTEAAGRRLFSDLASALSRGEPPPEEAILANVSFAFRLVQLLDEATGAPAPDSLPAEAENPYLMSSWFFADCASYLLSDPKRWELLHMATGSKSRDGLRTLDRMIPLPLAGHSEIRASANREELQKLLLEMDAWGHSLHGLFHSHPGQGKEATKPSSIDLATHERYERGGYPLVGAIVAKDGQVGAYLRFFSHSRPFSISLHGKGVTHVEEHVYHIRHLSHRVPAGSHRPAGEALRVHPAGAS